MSDLVKLAEDADISNLIGRLQTYFEVGLDKLTDSDGVEWSLYCDALRAAEQLAAFTAEAKRVEAERNALRAKTAVTMGVGDRAGQLFVYGDYESIKAAQAIVDEITALRAQVERMRSALGTDETGDALIEVARNAHRAEQELAALASEVKP